jgi:polyisoprenoid-binding protein YceI
MKKSILTFAIAGFVAITTAFAPAETKLVSKTGHINFFSHTAVEDITADNYKVVSTLDVASGEVVFSVPMQSFEFEKSLMQKHYNSAKFLDTKQFPKSKFKGIITNLSDVDFSKDGTYNTNVEGELTIHGITNKVSEKGKIVIDGEKVAVETTMNLTLADYEVAFKDGKPSTNIAKTIDITVKTEYNSEDNL